MHRPGGRSHDSDATSAEPPRAVLDLLRGLRPRCWPLDPRGQPWLLETETWRGVLRRFPPEVYSVQRTCAASAPGVAE
jgi:hypothetical protein